MLAVEMVVERALADAGVGDDALERRGFEPVDDEASARGAQNSRPRCLPPFVLRRDGDSPLQTDRRSVYRTDVAMETRVSAIPAPFAHLLAAWNERDPARIRQHAEQAVTADVAFTDPQYAIRGIDAFVAMVQEFRKRLPEARVERTSGIDRHHDRARYSWTVFADAKTRVDGFDAVALDAKGMLRRIDGFFGPLPPA